MIHTDGTRTIACRPIRHESGPDGASVTFESPTEAATRDALREGIRDLAGLATSIHSLPISDGRKYSLNQEVHAVRAGLRNIAQAAGVEY